ncbi:MAG: hypothetical protein M3162_08870 [Thermoproteota archaeon]|nr:hypothetical protein [Thermoproteota archaeon]
MRNILEQSPYNYFSQEKTIFVTQGMYIIPNLIYPEYTVYGQTISTWIIVVVVESNSNHVIVEILDILGFSLATCFNISSN